MPFWLGIIEGGGSGLTGAPKATQGIVEDLVFGMGKAEIEGPAHQQALGDKFLTKQA